MQDIISNFQTAVEDLVEQRDYLVLLVSCVDDHAALAMKTISDIDQANEVDLFVTFADAFVQTDAYEQVVAERLIQQHDAACLLCEDGEYSLAPLPASLKVSGKDQFQTAHETVQAAKALLPEGDGRHKLVCSFFPMTIDDANAYKKLIASFLPDGKPHPWLRGVRLVARIDPSMEPLWKDLLATSWIKLERFDLSQEAMQKSLQAEVANESLPTERRMQSLLQVAIFDSAYGRTDDARRKFDILLGHYQHTENPTMQAVVMNAIGDLYYHQLSDFEQAEHWYECALLPAGESKVGVVLFPILKSLGDLASKRNEFATAEAYYDYAHTTARHVPDPASTAQALEWRGQAQEQQHAYDRAVQSFEDAATLCRSFELPGQLKQLLEHLLRVYPQAGSSDRLMTTRDELRAVAEAVA